MTEIADLLNRVLEVGGKFGLYAVVFLAGLWLTSKAIVALVEALSVHLREERASRESERQQLIEAVNRSQGQLEILTQNHMTHLEASNQRAAEFQSKNLQLMESLVVRLESLSGELRRHAEKSEQDHDRIIDKLGQ